CGTDTYRGVDLNRNYEYEYGVDNNGSSPDPCSETYRGSGAFSEPETSHLRDFVLQHDFQNILHYHSFSNVLIHSFGNGKYPLEPDYTMITEIGEWMTIENEYRVGTGTDLINYTVNGDAVDWSYGTLGLLSYTPEIGDVFWPSENEVLPLCQDQLYQNKVFSLVAGSDPVITGIEQSSIMAGAGGLAGITFSIQNRGLLPSNGKVNVRIAPLNDFVSNSIIPDTIRHLESREIQDIRVDYNISFDAVEGEDTGFEITINDSLSLPHTEVVVFNVGPPIALPGDIVTDLVQNIFDVQVLADLIMNDTGMSGFAAFIADVNGDGKLTADDLTDIVNIIMEYE
ncbi:MAG: hypothetical protein GWO85_01215, partial [Simkaniaceae bacterium]|nr:hypothetical protein [Simkaniaceae bacterium]